MVIRFNTYEGTDFRVFSSPISVLLVLSWSQIILTSSVVWLFIKNPVTLKHVARVYVIIVEVTKYIRTVFSELPHMTLEIFFLVNADPK